MTRFVYENEKRKDKEEDENSGEHTEAVELKFEVRSMKFEVSGVFTEIVVNR